MTIRFVTMVVLFVLVFSSIGLTQAYAQKTLTIDLASDHVDITTGFNGANLILYGMKDRPGEIAVVIRGPEKKMTVRKKNRVLGLWMNTEHMDFDGVPAYYDYALSKKEGLSDAEEQVLFENGVGLATLIYEPRDAVPERDRIQSFQQALIRNKQLNHLFPMEAGSIEFLNDDFFRTTMYLPSNVPRGTYEIETFLFRQGQIIDRSATTMMVAPVGLNARVYDFATQKSFYYGLICIFIAVFAGWLINVIRNK
ncbi:MAG: transmembrane family protein [Micavibrio sp.]|nr:transmembrane family protein [Micavibrio sp.]|tara:strand:- start:3631 stop:4389 length:759 start_codon:yes stop_codon:yes gene_type:complete